MLRPRYRFSSHFMPILAAILSSIIAITAALLTPSILSSPRSSYAAGVGSPLCKLTVQNTDPSLQDLTRRYQIAFKAVCPTLVKRFAPRPDIANNIIVTFKSDLPSGQGGSIAGNQIDLNAAYLLEHPHEALGELIFYLSLAIQHHSADETTSWFPMAMAFYVRSIYGPKDDDWVLPSSVSPNDSYQDPGQGARFLHWLQQHTVPTLVDQLNRAMQTRQPFSAVFQRLTGGTVDQLWSKYKANPDLAPFQRFPVPSVPVRTSCKLTVQNDNPIAPRFQQVFKEACPILVKRFAYRADVANNVALTFKPSEYPEYAMGNGIFFDTKWLQGMPKNRIGVFIHSLTHVIQHYPPGAPGWFTEGMATYADSVYSPTGEPPAFPDSAGDSYKDGYGTAARFLHWLEQNTVPDIVDQLNRANQTGQSFSATFQRLTGGTVDELWDKYKAKPKLGPMRRAPIE